MASDILLLIPHLSKELNLIGLPSLPYNLRKTRKSNSKKVGEETLKIVFDSNLMIETLTSVSFELVKQIKAFGVIDNTHLDKLLFENLKLEKQLKVSKLELEKKGKDLSIAKEVNQQLQKKINHLEKALKDFKTEQKILTKKSQTNEDLLKHTLKKKDSHIFELHKTIWKQFNLANQNYFPENFKIAQLNQTNFNHLWSTVKYSDAKTKEEALKEAICTLEKNNKALIEENFFFKTFLLNIFQEFQDTLKLMVEKMHIPDFFVPGYNSSDLFTNEETFNFSVYDNILNSSIKIIKKICELFDEASFIVSDDLFVCWSNINKGLSAYFQ